MRIVLFLVLVAILNNTVCEAKTYVFLTVDVESRDSGNPERDIIGIIDDSHKKYGLPLIIETLNRKKVPATFYLNIYEKEKFGENKIKNIAQIIVDNEQDIQLHTHLKHMYGKLGLYSYEAEKQLQIINYGKNIIKLWTGRNAVSVRAGGYLADISSLEAIKKTGMLFDSSLSPGYSSPLFIQGYLNNDFSIINGLYEIPVTYYNQIEIFDYKSRRILDIESSSLSEIMYVISDMCSNNCVTVNLMMHSFSFVRNGFFDEKLYEKFIAILDYVKSNKNVEFIDVSRFSSLAKAGLVDISSNPNFVSKTGFLLTYMRSVERFNDGWKNKVFALTLPVLAFVFLVVFYLLKKRIIMDRKKH